MEKIWNSFCENSFCENRNIIFQNLFYENGIFLELLEVANNYVRAAYWNDHPKCEKCICLEVIWVEDSELRVSTV